MKKGIKHRFSKGKRDVNKPGGNGSDLGNESAEPSAIGDGNASNLGNESAEPSATGDGSGSDWGSIVSSTAKLLLRGVRDCRCLAAAQSCCRRSLFYPGELRGAVPFLIGYPQSLQVPQRMKANKQAIESLAPRVKKLAESLCKPVSEGDVDERKRRQKLEQ